MTTTSTKRRSLTIKTDQFDPSVLPEGARQPASPAFRDAMSAFLRRQFSRLDGNIESLSIDQDEIRVTWAQPQGSNPIHPIAEMLNKRQYAEAIPLMELLLSDNPDDTDILYNLGMVYSDRSEWEKSLACLNRLMELEPQNTNGRVALGTAFSRQGNIEQGLAELRRAVADAPTNLWAQRNLGAALAKAGHVEEGVAHLRQATELDPKNALTWFGLGLALEDSGDDSGADTAYRKVIELDKFGELADRAKEALSRIAERTFKSVIPGVERPDAVMYCLGALQRFESMSTSEIQKIGFEIGILGSKGLNPNDFTRKYSLQSLPGEYTALHLLCIMYVAFQKFAPEQDIGFDLSAEYERALGAYQEKSSGQQ
jgi:tetratricopeptide (TPR) repeat protein